MPRPSLAKAVDPGRPFGALLGAAVDDPAAASGLALAYASLPVEHRRALVDAVVSDAGREGICAAAVLASLLSVEEDTGVARDIASAMSMSGGADIAPLLRLRAQVAGDSVEGGIIVVRPLHGHFVEVLKLAWNRVNGVTHTLFEPLVAHTVVPGLSGLPEDLQFEEVPVAFAIDTVTSVLWNHCRIHGCLPDNVKHFADLFSIEPVG